MTGYGALATTGGVLLFVSLICALLHDKRMTYGQSAWSIPGTLSFITSAACFIAAAWWAAA